METSMNITEEIAEIPYDGKGVIEIINDTQNQVKLLKSKQKIVIFISYTPQAQIPQIEKTVIIEKEQSDVKVEKTESKSVIPETNSSNVSLRESPESGTYFDLPTDQQVIDFITSKPDFEYHTVELQEKFLGKRLRYRENPILYGAFDRIIHRATTQIAKMNNSKWEHFKTIPLGGKTHVSVYRLAKPKETEAKQTDIFA